ncbi:MAG: hypothetical protein R3F11_21500 [Verrucomicrobiales bacterium]
MLSRIFSPLADIPPLSPLTFAVTPEAPEIPYGGELALNVEIGGPLGDGDQVWLITRGPGGEHRAACFREGAHSFAQRLENVVEPVEFCFAAGRARSHWHRVDVLLQPKIAMATAEITPPEYARLPARQFVVGEGGLDGLRQSEVRLAVTSNRPPYGYRAWIFGGPALDQEIAAAEAERLSDKQVAFRWKIEGEARIEIAIEDLRGTANAEPYTLRQRVTPDQPPAVQITEPSGFALATPRSVVPLSGYAEDDLALAKVDLVRSVVGFRDRPHGMGPDAPDRRLEFSQKLDLAALGSAPGEVIELYLEARDLNPALTGVASSEIARIQVISEDRYAAMVRQRTTLREFLLRYEALDARIQEFSEAVEALKEAAEAGDETATEKALAEAQEAHQRAADLFGRIADDFPAFELEKKQVESAKGIAEEFKGHGEALGDIAEGRKAAAVAAAEILEKLGRSQQQVREQRAEAESVGAAARLMEVALKFGALAREQADAARRLERFSGPNPERNPGLLRALGEAEAKLAANATALLAELAEKAAALPEGFAELAGSAKAFARRFDEFGIREDLRKAAGFAENEDGTQAHQFAKVALEKLEQLLGGPAGGGQGEPGDPFAAMCQGRMEFGMPDGAGDGIGETLSQMLQALAGRTGGGQGSGMGGMGMGLGMGAGGGDGSDGYAMGGNTPLNIPIFGPDRLSLDGAGPGSRAGGNPDAAGGGSGRRGPGAGRAGESETIDAAAAGAEPEDRGAFTLEDVPEKYRDAVKRYFAADGE